MQRTGTAALLAVLAAATVGACGSGSAAPSVAGLPGRHSSAPPSQTEKLHLAGSCVRAHGVPGFPDPTSAGGSATLDKGAFLAVPKPVAARALEDCRAALDRAGIGLGRAHDRSGAGPSPAVLHKLLEFSRCMRRHGVPSFPDPNPANGEITLPAGTSKTSPALAAAQRACSSLLPS